MRSPTLKRALDVIGAGAGLVVTAPVLAVVAALIRVDMGAPVLFRQRRPGLHGRPFEMWKFRTMRDARDASGEPLPDPERLTRLGRFLRATSLDELPELANVLAGEMSLVGPRPLLPQYLALYDGEQRRRHDVLPGITGWAQVHGRNALSWEEKFRLDCWYVDHWSNGLDLRILLDTIRTVLGRDGIGHGDAATMPAFTGKPGAPDAGSR